MRKRLIKPMWQLHSWLGLVCGLGLIVVGVTGSLLVFHEELDAWRFPQWYHAQPTTAGRLPYDTLWAHLRGAFPEEQITGWTPASARDRTDAVYLSRPGEAEPRAVRLDPYTGEVRGKPVDLDRTLTGWLLELHYALLAGTGGTFVTGLLAVGLLLLGFSGLFIYRSFWRSLFTFRWDRSTRIFLSDLHKAVAISSVGFNLILGFTGAWWNLNAVYSRWTAPAPVVAATPAGRVPPAPLNFTPTGVSLDALLVRADHELPGYHPVYLALPPDQTGSITFFGTVPTPNPLRGDYGSRLTFAASDGALQSVLDIRRASVWEKIGDSFALLHYGTFGAVFGRGWDVVVKLVWTLLGLAPGGLALSGFLIWRARRRARTV